MRFTSVRPWMAAAVVLVCVRAIPAIAQTTPVPGRPSVPVHLPADVQRELDRAAAASKIRPSDYTLRPGDELDIRCHLIPQLDQTVRVRPDGRISLVLVNEVDAQARTAAELGQTLSQLYSTHFRNPQITVIVRTFNNLNVYVGGEVQRAGLVPLGGGLSLTAAIFQAGGFKDEEGPRRAVLLRQDGNGSPTIQTLDVAAVLLGGKPDMELQPSDVVFVPKTSINVFVGGEVVEPGMIPLNRKMTALTAILRAKGLRNTAQTKNVMLIRDTGENQPLVRKFDLARIMRTGVGDPELQPYDVLFVPKSRIARVDQFVDQYMRQLLPIGLNMGFSYVLGAPLY